MRKVSVSVIITCHNLESYLPECVESVYAQTMPASEIIIMHDGCSDLSQCYATATNVLRDSNIGVGKTRNQAALLATSDNLLFVDADDVLSENYIEAMVRTKQETNAQIIYPNVLLWSRWHKEVKLPNAWHESASEITKENMMQRNEVVVTSLIEKDLFWRLGGFGDEQMLEDYALFLKAVYEGVSFAKSPLSILKYRQRQGSRNRQSDELKNHMYFAIRENYEKS